MGKSEDEAFDEWFSDVTFPRIYGTELPDMAHTAFLAGRTSLANEIAKLRDQRDGLAQVANWFCKRVELGEIRSRRTYAAFREKLASIESESASPDAGKDEPFGKFDENVVNKAFDQAMKEPLEISVSNLDEYDDRYNGKRTEGT